MKYLQNLIALLVHCIQSVINFVESLLLKTNTSREFERSACVRRVFFRHKLAENYEFSSKYDFISIHESFEHPRHVLAERFSLYCLTEDEAVFVNCEEFDIFDSKYAFAYDTQFNNASQVITMPMSSFLLISKQITMPDVPVLHLANHGRCGSTLLTKLFEAIPNSLSISEVNGFTHVAEMSLKNGVEDYNRLKQICQSVVMFTLKHAVARKSSFVLIKCQSSAVYITDMMISTVPSIKQVFMYRQPVQFVQSYEKLMAVNKWDPPSDEICCYWGGIGNHKILPNACQQLPSAKVKTLSTFARWAIVWITGVAAYDQLIKKGVDMKSLKYEHLLEKPSETLTALFHYVGIPLSLMPSLDKVFSKDSQVGTPFSSRGGDKELLKQALTPVTEKLKMEINGICDEFSVPYFWDDIILQNKL